MSLYNKLPAEMVCPRCGASQEFEIDLYFGYRDFIRYELGDSYEWRPRKAVQNGGRPPNGDLDGEGYTQCSQCEKDFFVCVEIRGDKIVAVRPDISREPYIKD